MLSSSFFNRQILVQRYLQFPNAPHSKSLKNLAKSLKNHCSSLVCLFQKKCYRHKSWIRCCSLRRAQSFPFIGIKFPSFSQFHLMPFAHNFMPSPSPITFESIILLQQERQNQAPSDTQTRPSMMGARLCNHKQFILVLS